MPAVEKVLARAILFLGTLCAALGRPSAEEGRPSEQALRAVEERGRSIALYLEAASEAGAARERQAPQGAARDRAVVIQGRDVWRVAFLRESGQEAVKKMLLVAEALFNQTAGEVGEVRVFAPARSAPMATTAYARALQGSELAVRGRPDAVPPFDEAVFKEDDGSYTVYLRSKGNPGAQPEGPGERGSVHFGGDFLVKVAATVHEVTSTEPLHFETTLVSLAPRSPGQPTLHIHRQGDLPTATDVALVLRNPVLAPHLVLTPRFMFRIDSEGRVTYLGPNQAGAREYAPVGEQPGGPQRQGGGGVL